MNKLDLSRCLMFRTDPSVDSAPPCTRLSRFILIQILHKCLIRLLTVVYYEEFKAQSFMNPSVLAQRKFLVVKF